jgi:ABC-2 type transport system ATP-binding protein
MTDVRDVVVATAELTRRFGSLTAVDRVSIRVERGEIFGLVGPDGAGKTTTLRILCGLLDPTAGSAQIVGRDTRHDLDAIKDRIGYMAQRFGLYGDLTVDENMRFYADLFGIRRAEREALTGQLLRMTRMEPFRGRRALDLSGGMKQKLALMCTLLHRPEILFLDEPTNGVDPVSRRDFWAILYQLVREGLTVVITTAYLDEAERCSRVGMMHRGRLIRCEAPDSLRRNMKETCYEARTDDARHVKEFLERIPGVLSVEPAGATLHLFLKPEQISPGNLERQVAEGGFGSITFRKIVPSLEDAFIALIRKAESGVNTDGQ